MKIGEFSKLVGLPITTLRYYEEQGFLHIERVNGVRDYSEQDIGYVQFIKRLKDMGMPLVNIKKYADLRYRGNETIPERMELLKEHHIYLEEKIRDFEQYKQNLEDKLDLYASWQKTY